MNILLIEDNRDIATALIQALAKTHDTDWVSSGEAGIQKLRDHDYHCIVLDLNLPDRHGLTVCEDLRANGCQTPILILSAEAEVLSKIRLLNAGANDYLTKPFSLGELKARLKVLERLNISQENRIILDSQELTINSRAREVRRGDTSIKLRRKEFALLECLVRNAGHAVSRQSLGTYAWGEDDSPWNNTIDVHMKHLRDKLDRPFKTKLISTVHGIGYRLDVPKVAPNLTGAHREATAK